MPNTQTHFSKNKSQLNVGPVAVLGDVMLDVYVIGSVSRISPEAPVPVLQHIEDDERAGGAANVALNVAAIGGQARLLGLAGSDGNATRLETLTGKRGVDNRLIKTPLCPTITKTRIMSGRYHQFMRIDRETAITPSPDLEQEILQQLAQAIEGVGALILSDYGKGCLSDGVLQGAIALAREAGIPVLIDPKRTDFSAYAGATIIKPNLKELSAAVGRPCTTREEITAAAHELVALTGSSILLTMSERGMTLFDADGADPIFMPTVAKEVFDVSGAGDTVIAVFSSLLAGGLSIREAMHAATVAAGIVVSKAGTATLTLNELIEGLDLEDVVTHDHDHEQRGVFADWESLLEQRRTWERKGLSVGFTNGCFDLLHPGHVQLMREAAQSCDRLIVGLNTDASVQRLKGPTRPVQHELARATVLAALGDVDAVTLFDQDTPLELITVLQPDVLIKGADYTEDQIVGADVVRANGGEVVRVTLVEGQSTTKLIKRSQSDEAKA